MTDGAPPGVAPLFARGFSDLRRTARMVFPVYVVNLLTAVFAVLPLYLALHRITAHRPAAGRLIYTWDLEVLVEILTDHPGLLGQLQGTFVFVPVAYLLVSQLVLGGVLGALAREGRPGARHFGQDALQFFAPLGWVLVWAAIPYALAVLVGVLGWGMASSLPVWAQVAAVLPGLALLVWTDAAVDYARAVTVQRTVTPSIRRLLSGYLVVLRRPWAALAIHLGYGLLGWLPVLVLWWLPDGLDSGSTGWVVLAFGLRQVLVFARVGLRVASLGSHLRLVRIA